MDAVFNWNNSANLATGTICCTGGAWTFIHYGSPHIIEFGILQALQLQICRISRLCIKQ
jgi:hypothetical protein